MEDHSISLLAPSLPLFFKKFFFYLVSFAQNEIFFKVDLFNIPGPNRSYVVFDHFLSLSFCDSLLSIGEKKMRRERGGGGRLCQQQEEKKG